MVTIISYTIYSNDTS